MSEFFDGDTYEPEIETTPNIEFQLNQINDNEYLLKKYIPDKALFATSNTIASIKTIYENNIDIPIIVYGNKGIGKITSIIGLLKYLPCYLPEYEINHKLNNLHYFKILDEKFNKIFYYENIYFINLESLNNNNEITEYLEYIYKLAKSSNIQIFNDNFEENDIDKTIDKTIDKKIDKTIDKKIIIIAHIDKCSKELQKFIAFMLEKINNEISYILTTYNTNTIAKKIMSICLPIHFKNLNENTFNKIFKTNFKNSLEENKLSTTLLKNYYQIYVANRYNIGNTISQIKYYLETEDIEYFKNKHNRISLLSKIAENFIKKKLILSNVSSALEIRKFLYTLLSLNIKLIIFVKEVIKQLCNNSKLNNNIKYSIVEKVNTMSSEIIKSNKEIVIIESFFYDIITIIYADVK